MNADDTKDLARRVHILEDKDKYNDKRLRKIEDQMEAYRKEINENMDKLFMSLKEIEKGQHTQEITNLKMNYTLDTINKDREKETKTKEESRKQFKQLKWLILGMITTILGSLIVAVVRTWFGI